MGVNEVTYEVLICDDDEELERDWVEQVSSSAPQDIYEVGGLSSLTLDSEHLDDIDLKASIDELLTRRSLSRENGQLEQKIGECVFDRADVLILDYDLIHVDETERRHTGEGLARLARTFSNCGAILVLNQFRDIQFDLTLNGHLWSYADLNLNADLLPTVGLWTNPPWRGFRPWAWNTMSNAVELQRSRTDFVDARYEANILESIGMRQEDVRRMSDSAFEFICPGEGDPSKLADLTFETFLQEKVNDLDARAIGEKDRQAAARFVGSRIGKWLEVDVLAGQDVLVDVPHLIERYPFLLGDHFKDLDAWNNSIHDDSTIKELIPNECWFEYPEILSRPAVWRHRFEADEEIVERTYSFEYSKVPAFVFLEDVSQFGELSGAKEFRAGFHNGFDSRHVLGVDGIRYAPQRRFALRD
ncbi:MAG: hypothetical protein OXG25_10280 [Gammaproteobacteria bacterium]|nr:hypothetical protein [Gammaproteobacteria bacterium]